MVAKAFCFMSQVIRVYTDAVTANQAWTVGEEVPFGACSR